MPARDSNCPPYICTRFNMVNIKKIRWIPVLMIFSQILLTGFVVYWLMSQFRDEKDLVHEELSRYYQESRNQVIDSLVFNRVVEPALKDSVTVVLSTSNISDTFNYQPNRPLSTTKKVSGFGFINAKQDMLIRSVKLFIKHDSTGRERERMGEPMFEGFPGILDSCLFQQFYKQKTDLKNIGISLTWIPDSIFRLVKKPGDRMVISSTLPERLPAVRISNVFPYLLTRMSPQILFALILLILTGSAFYYTNRSLNRQILLNSLRNDFVSNITHELKTPVSTVKVALEALRTFDKAKNPEVMKDYLDMAGQELNRLDQLITQVLDQSLIGEQQQVIKMTETELGPLIDVTVKSLEPRIAAQNASLRFDGGEIKTMARVDPLHFQGILTNLIDNSLKYGVDSPEISIRLFQDKNSACVEVSDNGPGIPSEYLNRVFDRFFRVPKGDTHNIKGYGLGLSFAAEVMKQHQGSISVKNINPAGCAYTLRFPLKEK